MDMQLQDEAGREQAENGPAAGKVRMRDNPQALPSHG
jgi:hypothetical protein